LNKSFIFCLDSVEVLTFTVSIAEKLKPKTDYHAWAKRILRNPKNFPETSVMAAREVLGENYAMERN